MADLSAPVALSNGCAPPSRSVYLFFLAESFGRVPLNLFATGARPTAPIDQVYVSPCFRPASQSPAGWGPTNRSQLHESLFGERRRYQWESVLRWFPDKHVISSADRLLEAYPRLVVSGEVGTGKSTLLAYMTWKGAVGNGPGLPLFFSLRACDPDGSLPNPAQPPEWCEPLAGPFFQHLLERESCLLLFDGLDEVAPAARERIVARIEALAVCYPGHGFALTTRPDALPGADRLSGFGRVTVEPLDASRLEHWARRFHRAAGAGLRERREMQRFVEALRDSDSAFSGILSPLLLKALAQLQREGLDMHRGLDGLCRRCLRLLLEEWDASKGIASLFLLDYKLRVLQQIALQQLRAGREDAPIAEVEATARRRATALGLRPEYVLPLLDEIARRNGLLVSRSPGRLGFFFGWLQRYLAARELREQADGAEELLDHLGDADWERTSLFYANLGDATYLVGLLMGMEDPFQRHLLLAGRCAAVAPALAANLRGQVVEALIRLSRLSPFESVSSGACKVLAQIGDEAALAHLRVLLTGKDEDRRRQVLAVLTSAPAEPLADLLEKTFRESPSPHARALAVDGLGRLGEPHGQGIWPTALGDPTWEVRAQALNALGWRADPAFIPVFTAFLEQGYWCVQQQRAAVRLSELFGGMEDQVLRQSAEDKDGFTRRAAVRGLVATEEPEATAVLEERLVHPNWHVRLYAAYGLLLTGRSRAAEVLARGAAHADESVRYSLTGVLGDLATHYLSEEQYLEIEGALLRDSAWRVRGAALSVWSVDSDALLDLIEAAVEHPVAYVHVRAVRALGYIRIPEVTQRLLALLAGTRRDGQVLAACEALHRQRCAAAEPLVLGRLAEGFNEHIVPVLLYYLLELGTPRALPYLADYLHYSGPEIRGMAFEVARRICGRHGIDPPAAVGDALRCPRTFDAVFMRRYDTAVL